MAEKRRAEGIIELYRAWRYLRYLCGTGHAARRLGWTLSERRGSDASERDEAGSHVQRGSGGSGRRRAQYL